MASDSERILAAFNSKYHALTLVLKSNLPDIVSKLYSKSIISRDARDEAMNVTHTASVRTVYLLSVVEDRIRAEPHTFTEFVEILESEPTLTSLAIELMEEYNNGK